MKKRILQAVLLSTLSVSFLGAQMMPTNPPTPPTPAQTAANIVARLSTLLDLTGAQQITATSIFTTEQTALAALVTPMQTAQTALQAAIVANKGIATAAATIGSLTTQQVTADATADAAFYVILTPTQQAKYTTLKLDQDGGFGPMGGGGGPHGPGGRGGR